MNTKNISISKILSSNDIGSTGAHQAGILVPKNNDILSFFPELNKDEKNPRIIMNFISTEGLKWKFAFIYYNNKFFGGTRNEFRLTRMTKFFKGNNLKAGDEIYLKRDPNGNLSVSFKRKIDNSSSKLKLSGSWRVVKL